MPKKKKEKPQAGQAQEGQARTLEVGVAALREALDMVGPTVPRRPTLPVLKHVLLGQGQVVATDLEQAVAVALPGAEAEVLLPHEDALEFLRYTPGHLTAHITAHNGTVSIAAGGMESQFKVPDPEDFPPVPFAGPDQMEHQGVLDGDALVRALAAVLPCAATDESRPVLAGVCLTPGDRVEVAAADGYRLAWEDIPGRLPGDGHILVRAGAVRILERLWKKAAAPDLSEASDSARIALAKRLIRLEWGNGRLQMRFGKVVLLTNLIQGTFPSYQQLIPTEPVSSVTVLAEEVDRALRQIHRVAGQGSGIVRLVWEGDSLQVSARAENVGDTTVPVPASSTGPGRVAVNISYLLTYFSGRQGQVTVSLAPTEGAPVTFAHRGTPHIIMMPMGVKDE